MNRGVEGEEGLVGKWEGEKGHFCQPEALHGMAWSKALLRVPVNKRYLNCLLSKASFSLIPEFLARREGA